MPDFTVRPTSGAILEGWTYADFPSRINPFSSHGHKRYRVPVGDPVEFQCTVDGVEGPVDGDLDGRLFNWWFVEWPVAQPPITVTGGSTSIATFTPPFAGHYVLGVRRDNGVAYGPAVLFHIDSH
jgi:hypothetical protein